MGKAVSRHIVVSFQSVDGGIFVADGIGMDADEDVGVNPFGVGRWRDEFTFSHRRNL